MHGDSDIDHYYLYALEFHQKNFLWFITYTPLADGPKASFAGKGFCVRHPLKDSPEHK